ncbi:MAG: pyridoxal phosphate-dependent aminotransferase [Chlorobi bacterium]|nr:pyridoxal phosphate-dependent aminotransferase [Chlorobiota bacterium]
MRQTPVKAGIVEEVLRQNDLARPGAGAIREIVRIVNQIEARTNVRFVRMEMGVPGLPAAPPGIQAEIEALQRGVASKYPMIEGVQELKEEIARFAHLFMNIETNPKGCLPTVGSMMGSMASFMVANRTDRNKEGTLFLDPGFPVQKQQVHVLGHSYMSFDIFDYRGDKLKDKLYAYLKTGKVSSILYSSPNNPAWFILTEEELKTIGEMAAEYGVVVIEDLAYFGMDFRQDYSIPGVPPYQPTVARYTNDYILLISSSKAFSYAGQRIGIMIISDHLYHRRFPDLLRYFSSDEFGYAMIYGALYSLSAGVSHSSQWGLRGILKAANDGTYNFIEVVKEYGRRAARMKEIFLRNGFKLVYDYDLNEKLADGFYFTVSYPGFEGADLIVELLYYGVSAIALETTGSIRTEGVRACVSQIADNQYDELDRRLACFRKDHPVQ